MKNKNIKIGLSLGIILYTIITGHIFYTNNLEWWITGILIITFTITILKDTYIKKYYTDCDKIKLIKEYDLELPIWSLLLILGIGMVPIINILLFILGISFYIVKATNKPKCDYVRVQVYSLKGETWITRIILTIIKFLYIKI